MKAYPRGLPVVLSCTITICERSGYNKNIQTLCLVRQSILLWRHCAAFSCPGQCAYLPDGSVDFELSAQFRFGRVVVLKIQNQIHVIHAIIHRIVNA